MRKAGLTRTLLRRLLRFVPTPGWTRRYPHLNRLEFCKKRALCDLLLRESGHMVFSGPFATMKLQDNLTLATDPRCIIGCYEQEVHDVINDVICSAPCTVIDIGAAFGYYAVGLALKITGSEVIAFEEVEEPHWGQLRELATLNGVNGRVTQLGLCTVKELERTCRENAFILCDCEGGEEYLLDPRQVPSLETCTILTELHEFHRPSLVGTLVARFKESHNIRLIEGRERNPSAIQILKKLPQSWRSVAMEETKWVGDMPPRTSTWLRFMLLTPK